MKDSRIGESLWFIWDGINHPDTSSDSLILYTEEHIDIDEDVVRRALASTLQREGIVSSLGHGFSLIDGATNGHSYISFSAEYQSFCDKDGLTESGESLDQIIPVTWVEIIEID